MNAPPLLDPFEHELTYADGPRVVSFAKRAFEIALEDLCRNLAFDLVGGIPRPLGKVSEEIEHDGSVFSYTSAFFQVRNSPMLALCTQIREETRRHRVLELLGVNEDLRVRVNMTQFDPATLDSKNSFSETARQNILEGRALGQVRVWGRAADSARAEVRATVARQMQSAGMAMRVLDRSVAEPQYAPPASDRMTLDGMPHDDLRVAHTLLELLDRLPVEGAQVRNPRRISVERKRSRRKGSIVTFNYETHRSATGVLHIRRREVEAGVERPGLVRTFNVAGLRGAGRLRIRDVGRRVIAHFAGTPETVDTIRTVLAGKMGGRAG